VLLNASCLNPTLPEDCCLFFPRFCFSNNFFFRLTSPPPTDLLPPVVKTSLRWARIRSLAKILESIFACMTVTNCCRGNTSCNFLHTTRPCCCATSLWQTNERGPTLSAFKTMSTLQRFPSWYGGSLSKHIPRSMFSAHRENR